MTVFKYAAEAASVMWDSEEQRSQFLLAAEQEDWVTVERMLSVMNKPSQFVGRVSDFESAKAHWQAWDAWQVANKEAEDVDTEDTATSKSRGRLSVHNKELVEFASEKWHAAVAGRRQAKLDWRNWQRSEIARVREQVRLADEAWDKYVSDMRKELSQLQDGN